MYLYHFVPDDQAGRTLYPLNQLKAKNPKLYQKHTAKYANIKEKDVEIPGFGTWNDCINLMPVDPGLVKRELEKYGHDTNWRWRFYQINPTDLDQSSLIIMVPLDGEDVSKRKYVEFTKSAYNQYARIGDVTRYRFQKAKDTGKQPNTFAGIPHVLYKSSIDTTDLNIIEF